MSLIQTFLKIIVKKNCLKFAKISQNNLKAADGKQSFISKIQNENMEYKECELRSSNRTR